MEKPSQAKKKMISLLSRSLGEMKTLVYEAESSGNIDQARWMCYRLTSALDRVEDFSSSEKCDLLARIACFYKQHGDHTEADRVVQKMLRLSSSVQSTHSMSPTTLYREFMEKTPETAFSNSADFKDVLPLLHRVVTCGNEELFFHLRSSTSEPSADCCIFGRTLLHAATEKGSVNVLERLLDDGMEIDVRDSFGRTSLFLAASLGEEGAFRFLLSRGPNLEVRDCASHSLMETAARGNHVSIMKILFDQGCNVNEQALSMHGGCFPLHAAAENGCFEAVNFLVMHGADTSVELEDRRTADKVARDNGFPDIAEFLKRKSICAVTSEP